MKLTVKQLLWSLSFPTLLCFVQCGEKEEPYVGITGKWKLMEARSMTIVDYSGDRILFVFGMGGRMKVENVLGTPSWGPGEGEHTYDFYDQDTTSWQGYTMVGKLEIGERVYGCYLSAEGMVIVDNPHLDGPLVYFERVR
ncbi:hypothetical protein [Pleomorphovibrio marinus]|uniref:hypothetical protein n=1 Tax=Pleomorphovibrio marinus TaxID=2164132 RepID=UPI000E0B24E9|nr:hypothetical protein [Pleomorphovibrio marinus]